MGRDVPAYKILVAMDSFKGSLSAARACEAVAAGLREGFREAGRPDPELDLRPMSDGGEGALEVIQAGIGGRLRPEMVTGPLPDRFVLAPWLDLEEEGTAVVEMAAASGLTLLEDGERDPLRTTTRGTGELLAAAAGAGRREVLLTLGGSATVDGGTGVARALGWRFLDGAGRPVPEGGGGLERIVRIAPPTSAWGVAVLALADVDNPMVGPEGAARVFAPQKGAGPEATRRLEEGLVNLAERIRTDLGLDVADLPGGGAAGGLGAGAVAFLGADLRPGFQTIAEMVGLPEAVGWADWVVTGEGCLDRQSLRGKVVSGVVSLARAAGGSVAVVAGEVALSGSEMGEAGISVGVAVRREGEGSMEAMGRGAAGVRDAARRAARTMVTAGRG